MGYLFIVIASMIYGISPNITKVVLNHGVSVKGATILGSFFSILTSLIVCLFSCGFRIGKKQLLWFGLIGLVSFGCILCLNTAYTLMPVGFVTTIHFLYPTIITIYNSVFFGEKITAHKIAVMCLSFSGFLLFAYDQMHVNALGILLALLSAFLWAAYTLSLDKSPISGIEPFKKTLYIATASICFSSLSSIGEDVFGVLGLGDVLICMAVGTFGCLATYCFNRGITILGSSKAAFINTLEPVVSMLTTLYMERIMIDLPALTGSLLILFSLMLTVLER